MKKRKRNIEDDKIRIAFQFSHEEVLSQNLERFFDVFGDANLPKGEPLKKMQGGTYLAVDGYDNDSRSLPEIPEVRQFFRALYKQFPHWFFFLVPETLPTLALCLFKEYSGVRNEAVKDIQHRFKKTEMADFVEEQAPHLQKMCLSAGMTLKDFDRIYYELAVLLLPEVAKSVPRPH